jgi:O-antigen ligase
MISEKKYCELIEFFLIVIAISLTFRKPCTYLIIAFSLFGLFFFKKLAFTKKSLQLGLIISLPIIVEILFFWNNDSLILGLKSLEKSITLLLFPIFIIGNYKNVDFYKIAKFYSIITTLIVLGYYISYINFDTTYLTIYTKRDDYFWAIGYAFSNYVGMHGPALNMHLAFVTIINFYFIFYNFKSTLFQKTFSFILFCISFYLMIFINSKLAFANSLFGIVLIFAIELRKLFSPKRVFVLFATVSILLASITYLYIQKNPYMITKYQEKTFAHFDKIGKLDEVKNPEATVYHSLATRISIWKSTLELVSQNLLIGVGASDAKLELIKYFKNTNQKFLAKFEFPVHNQFLDSLLKFGILGLISTFLYIFNIARLGYKTKNTLIIFFFVLFFTSNLTDDFLIRFDGIVFSGFWVSIFSAFYLQKTYLQENAAII